MIRNCLSGSRVSCGIDCIPMAALLPSTSVNSYRNATYPHASTSNMYASPSPAFMTYPAKSGRPSVPYSLRLSMPRFAKESTLSKGTNSTVALLRCLHVRIASQSESRKPATPMYCAMKSSFSMFRILTRRP